jgi:N,N'-diacetylchitobiose transport system permease protein
MTSSTISSVEGANGGAAAAPRRPRSGEPRPRARRDLAPVWLLTPAAIVILVITVVPILFLLFMSFTDYGQVSLFTGAFNGVGFAQYAGILADSDFWWSLVRTVVFTGALVVGSVVIGAAVSQMLIRLGTWMRTVVTVVLIFAWAMPTVASSLVWVWLFQPGYGVVNWLLTQLRVFGDVQNLNWSQDPMLAFTCIWMLVVWGSVPFIALTLYAAQTQIAPEYFEAARLDGAGEWRIYWSVTAKFLQPTLLLVSILSIIWDFNVFNQIWLVSQGGPGNSTSTLGVWTYKTAFVGFHLGEGAAISVVTTVLLMLFTGLYIRNLIRSGEDL